MLYEVGVSSAAAAVATCESGTDESEDFFYILSTTEIPRSGATTNQFGDQKDLFSVTHSRRTIPVAPNATLANATSCRLLLALHNVGSSTMSAASISTHAA